MSVPYFVKQSPYPQVISGQRECGSGKCGKEIDGTCEHTAPAACVNGVNDTAYVCGLLLSGGVCMQGGWAILTAIPAAGEISFRRVAASISSGVRFYAENSIEVCTIP